MCVCVCIWWRERKIKHSKKRPSKSQIVWYGLLSVVHSFLEWTVHNLFFFFSTSSSLRYVFYSFFLSFHLVFTRISTSFYSVKEKDLKSHRRITVKSLFFSFHFICFWNGAYSFARQRDRAQNKYWPKIKTAMERTKKREKEIWSKQNKKNLEMKRKKP